MRRVCSVYSFIIDLARIFRKSVFDIYLTKWANCGNQKKIKIYA